MTYVKVLLAIALGAFAGATLSLELAAHVGLYELMWLPGMLVGGALGWTCTAPLEAWRAFRDAVRKPRIPILAQVRLAARWIFQLLSIVFSSVCTLLGHAAFFALLSFWAIDVDAISYTQEDAYVVAGALVGAVSFGVLCSLFKSTRVWRGLYDDVQEGTPNIRGYLTDVGENVIAVPSVFFLVCCMLVAMAGALLLGVYFALVATYRLVHGHERAYAFFWAAVGAVVGYFTYNDVIGAAAGVVGAIVSYGVLWVLHRTFAVLAK